MFDLFFALWTPAAVWIAWGMFANAMGWLDMDPAEALRKTFSPSFWRTGK